MPLRLPPTAAHTARQRVGSCMPAPIRPPSIATFHAPAIRQGGIRQRTHACRTRQPPTACHTARRVGSTPPHDLTTLRSPTCQTRQTSSHLSLNKARHGSVHTPATVGNRPLPATRQGGMGTAPLHGLTTLRSPTCQIRQVPSYLSLGKAGYGSVRTPAKVCNRPPPTTRQSRWDLRGRTISQCSVARSSTC